MYTARAIDGAFGEYDHLTCFAMKANSNLAILDIVGKEGLGVDIVSGGELFRALKAGIDPKKIMFSGVGKSENEIGFALKEGILCLNVESEAELKTVDRVARDLELTAPIALRINPDVDPKTHPKISTGLKAAKFGIPHQMALYAYRKADSLPGLNVIGIDCHIGSQLTTVAPFVEAAERLLSLIEQIRGAGIKITLADIGGGLGITYDAETPPTPDEWGQAVGEILSPAGLTIVLEPGRSIVGNTGALVTKTLYRKTNETKEFVVVDAAMNDLARPSMYDSYHEIRPVVTHTDDRNITADIVGPICETGDVLARDRTIAEPSAGDLLAVMSAGAYGFAMSSTYNSRPRVPEVLVMGDRWEIIRERETWDDLIAGERVVDNTEDLRVTLDA
jgi:diaminopimelate decarboxylase